MTFLVKTIVTFLAMGTIGVATSHAKIMAERLIDMKSEDLDEEEEYEEYDDEEDED